MQQKNLVRRLLHITVLGVIVFSMSLCLSEALAQGPRDAGGMTPMQQRAQGPGVQPAPRGGPPGFARPGPMAQPRGPGPGEEEAEPEELDLSKIDPATRDPFWPVGFMAKSEEEVEEEKKIEEIEEIAFEPRWDEAQKNLEVRGTMKIGAGNVANINDQIVQEGETISVDYEGYTYVWLIKKVAPDSIQMDRKEFIPMGDAPPPDSGPGPGPGQ